MESSSPISKPRYDLFKFDRNNNIEVIRLVNSRMNIHNNHIVCASIPLRLLANSHLLTVCYDPTRCSHLLVTTEKLLGYISAVASCFEQLLYCANYLLHLHSRTVDLTRRALHAPDWLWYVSSSVGDGPA